MMKKILPILTLAICTQGFASTNVLPTSIDVVKFVEKVTKAKQDPDFLDFDVQRFEAESMEYIQATFRDKSFDGKSTQINKVGAVGYLVSRNIKTGNASYAYIEYVFECETPTFVTIEKNFDTNGNYNRASITSRLISIFKFEKGIKQKACSMILDNITKKTT